MGRRGHDHQVHLRPHGLPRRAGAVSPFGTELLWVGGPEATLEACQVLYGEISRRAYAASIFPFIQRLPHTPGFNLSLGEANELPIWLAEELINLLPRPKEEMIGEVTTSDGHSVSPTLAAAMLGEE